MRFLYAAAAALPAVLAACDRPSNVVPSPPSMIAVRGATTSDLEQSLRVDEFVTDSYLRGKPACGETITRAGTSRHVALSLPDNSGIDISVFVNNKGIRKVTTIERVWRGGNGFVISMLGGASSANLIRDGKDEVIPVSGSMGDRIERLGTLALAVRCGNSTTTKYRPPV